MKRIAIVGSVNPARTDYDPPAAHHADLDAACEALGRELAQQGLGLIVYSASPEYIDAKVVSAYVASGKADPGSIAVVFSASDAAAASFAEQKQQPELFELTPDRSPDWEVAYFQSLAKADGVLLIGGGYSTFITGILARSLLIPLVTLNHFGGAAAKVWRALIDGQDLASRAAIDAMGVPPSALSVPKLIRSFDEQTSTRRKRRDGQLGTTKLVISALALIAWVAALPTGYLLLQSEPASLPRKLFLFVLFVTPLVAGFSGSTFRYILPSEEVPRTRDTISGAAAGAAAGILYLGSQLAGGASLDNFVWLMFGAIFGFVGGLTYDRVFAKLQSSDVSRTEILTR
ncbi:MAG TPA: hypothetical protein VMG12_11370 [Polyangiaceae bacterium]|nr:hypothetical protein [Polyangiaceae bacterium]